MKILILSLILFVSTANAFERGSISKEQAISDVCSESDSLCTYLKTLNISNQGDGIRMSDGTRVMPYRFSFAAEDLFVEIDRDANGNLIVSVQQKPGE